MHEVDGQCVVRAAGLSLLTPCVGWSIGMTPTINHNNIIICVAAVPWRYLTEMSDI
eukprot:m.165779 g.165779  ORF g.165779 m.165779 type:complete len:56 (+) comp24986_c0_seq3:88-255(+)